MGGTVALQRTSNQMMKYIMEETYLKIISLAFLLVLSTVACAGPSPGLESPTGEVYPASSQQAVPTLVGTLQPYPSGGQTPTPFETHASSDDTMVSPAYPAPVGAYPSPIKTLPRDSQMIRGNVFIKGKDLLVLESFPPQFVLQLTGSLPTPCHQLQVEVSKPDDQNNIKVEVYSITDPDRICIQVLKPFEKNIPLGSFSSGKYSVLLNGEKVGEISP